MPPGSATDATVHTGDFMAASVLADLERFGPVVAVHGNMDDGALRAALPVRTTAEARGAESGSCTTAARLSAGTSACARLFPGCDVSRLQAQPHAGGLAGSRRLDREPRQSDGKAARSRAHDGRDPGRGRS